jgi:uracil-DNA glycosylase
MQGHWIVEPRDPRHGEGEQVDGGSLLVVPSDGPVRMIDSHPSAPELIGLQHLAEIAGFPVAWCEILDDYLSDFDWWHLIDWLEAERATTTVYPDEKDVFNAFRLTSYDDVRVVILGQDPYPRPGQADGLAFSVPVDTSKPRALINIHRLLKADLEREPPAHGNLEGWARQGVLLLNAALTVRRDDEGSHLAEWEAVTDAVIQAVSDKEEPVVFMLWGAAARAKRGLIAPHHHVIEAAHPTSYPSAKDPFIMSESFKKADEFLHGAIDWNSAGPLGEST